MTLCASLSITLGCGGKPPASASKAVVGEAHSKPAEAAPAPAPEAPAEAAPAPAANAAATPAPAPAAAPAAAEAAPAAAPAAGEVTYVIEANDDSDISWVGYKVTGSKQGGFADFSGTVKVPGGDLTKAQIEVNVDLASVFSEAGALTEKLKAEKGFFEIATFPTSKFTSSAIEKTAEGYTVTGDFDLHGVVKQIAFPAQISVEGDTLKATAEFTIDRNVWGISYAGVLDDLIKSEVLISFNIAASAK
jgi:polyisoprenoid-binding protein YceI